VRDLDLHSTSSRLWLWIQVEVNRRWFGRPEYTVTVNAGADCAFVLLLVMIMEKKREERAAAANRRAAATNANAGAAGGGF
jgi:hypothetical protein